MKSLAKNLVFAFAKFTGLFALSRLVTARKLRILCYHGCAHDDEHKFSPTLFMSSETFAKRMKYLADAGYTVLPLRRALENLKQGTLPRYATVITIDDGWYGTYKFQFPILKAHGFPATLYVSSYYMEKQTQVFNVALRYVIWKNDVDELDTSKFNLGSEIELANGQILKGKEIVFRLGEVAESLSCSAARQSLLVEFCIEVGFDWETMKRSRQLSFMNADEALELANNGIDIQLHTHRHRFKGLGLDQLSSEIKDNRRALNGIAISELSQFCYPSGNYSPDKVGWLRELGISSATTTEPGFCSKGVDFFKLPRLLDSEALSELEFEAELSGFLEMTRGLRHRT